MTNVPFIEFQNVAFAYGARPILQNVSFAVEQGRFAAIMGGSGSGKTTLMRLITGQLRPSTGKVLLNGRDLGAFSAHELNEHRRRMGVLFQQGALFTDLNVFDNLAFPMRELTELPESVIRDLVLLKLNAVGLRGVEKLMPAELSGGMARRVALARTIALDPELMLFDEPFTGLDPISLGVIAHLIHRVTKSLRSTSIMVTHDVGQFCFQAAWTKCSNQIQNGLSSLWVVYPMVLWRFVIPRKRVCSKICGWQKDERTA